MRWVLPAVFATAVSLAVACSEDDGDEVTGDDSNAGAPAGGAGGTASGGQSGTSTGGAGGSSMGGAGGSSSGGAGNTAGNAGASTGGTAGEGGEGAEGGMDSTGGTAGSSSGGSAGSGQAGGSGGGGGGAPSWSCGGEAACVCTYSTMMLTSPSCPELPCCFTHSVNMTEYCTCVDAEETVCPEFIDTAMGERVTACPPP
jgi:hypothetical protein